MTETYAERLEILKGMVEAIDGDFTAQTFGIEMDVQGIVEDLKWFIEQAEQVQELEGLKTHYMNQIQELTMFNDKGIKENKRLRETLSFYSRHDNWWTYPVPGGYASAISVDKGERARRELKLYEPK